MLSKEELKHYGQLPDNKIGGYRETPETRRREIQMRLIPLEERLKSERDGEKRVGLLIEHAELLKELCRLNVSDNACGEQTAEKCKEILSIEGN